MCGIAGYTRGWFVDDPETQLRAMGDVIRHRGPDASGLYSDDFIAMVHRRLSIIDLTESGNQPMYSADRRYVIVYNGEIYNFLDLKSRLEKQGAVFSTRTDTEVLLELYRRRGADCLDELNGMFAFAVWDSQDRKLFLARDRIGKKPLYYYHDGDRSFAFSSEIKSLLQIPGFSPKVDYTAVQDFLAYQYIPSPKTIFANVYKLQPGHYLEISYPHSLKTVKYWDVDFSSHADLSLEDAGDALTDLLEDSTRLRMIADVPLGAFLSGGIDSSAVVAMMAKSSRDKVRTCTIGFDDKEHDESLYARTIADHFRTDHHEYRVVDDIPTTVMAMPRYFDEPFADSSAVPTYHVSRLARQAVTVALAGDGGDESFGGYTKYAVELMENAVRRHVPDMILRLIHRACGDSGSRLLRKTRSLTGSALLEPARACYRSNSYVTEQVMGSLLADDVRTETSGYDPAEHIVRLWAESMGEDYLSKAIYADLKTYLPDDILVKVDRMSMAHSLEVRAPFLDYRIIELAAGLPSHFKARFGQKKIVLKKAFEKLLPRHILDRRKHGFTVPLDAWFRNELKSVAETALVHSQDTKRFFNGKSVLAMWQEHQSGKRNHGAVLWSLFMFALWQKEYLK